MNLPVPDLLALNRLLSHGLDLAPQERAAWLRSLAPEHASLRPTLQHLLERADGPETSDLIDALPRLNVDEHEGRAAGDTVGPYTLRRPLGQGGMGTVWLAERSDGGLKRALALKLPLVAGQPMLRQRLARERDILAALAHPNIARLYDAGVGAGGQPYLALEYVDGQAIDAWCREHAASVEARLRLFLQVARAVAYAHANLVLHRDLKPANILVTEDGQVRLLDFGIAKLIENGDARATELTQAAGRALTPDYASPEQILGHPLGVASDVYALGVVLCELLCGQRPYRLARESRGQLEDAIVALEPTPPSRLAGTRALQRRLAGDLDTIVAKALKKAPAERYPTVDALAQDIERHLDGRAVLARPDSAGYRLRRFALRNRLALGAAAAVLVALLAGSVVALAEARNARLEARKALAVQAFMTDVFRANSHDQADPQKAQTTTARELLAIGTRKIETELADAPQAKAEVLRTFGQLLAEFGLDDEAVKVQRQRVALLRTLVGRDDARLAEGLLALADALEASSAAADRDAVLAEAGGIVAAAATPALEAELRFQLARAAQYRDWPASAHHAGAAVDGFRALGDAKRLMVSLQLVALAADQARDFETAERSLTEGVAIARALPQGSAQLPQMLTELASVQSERLNLEAADATHRAAVQTALQIYGADHDVYVDALIELGAFLAQAARAREALPFLRQAVQTRLRTKGENERYHLPRAMSLLGIVLADYGLAEEGASWLERVVRLKHEGEQNLAVAAFLHFAAHAQTDAGHMARAQQLLEEATRIIGDPSGAAARDVAQRNRTERARWALRMGRAAEALALLRDAGVGADGVPATRADLGARVQLAETLAAAGDTAAARHAVEQARQAIDRLRLGGAGAREAARLDIVDAAGLAPVAAVPLLRRALTERQRILDRQSPLIGEASILLAQALRRSGQGHEAVALARQGRTILAAHASLPPNLARLAQSPL